MEKKRSVGVTRDRSPGLYERIFNAIRVSSLNFGGIRRRVSFSPIAAPPNPKFTTPTADLIKIKSEKKTKVKESHPHPHHHHHVEIPIHRTEEKKEDHHHQVEIPFHRTEEKKEDHHHIENRFTDYINRAKMKMQTGSDIGGGKGGDLQQQKQHDDHFTEFIDRARMKMRTGLSMNDGKAK